MRWIHFIVEYYPEEGPSFSMPCKMLSSGIYLKESQYYAPWYWLVDVNVNGRRVEQKKWVPHMILGLVQSYEDRHGVPLRSILVDLMEYEVVEKMQEMGDSFLRNQRARIDGVLVD